MMDIKEKLEKIKSLADKMYYTAHYLTTDASHLRKAMDEYHQFIINDYYKEEPVSENLEKAAVEAFKHIVDSDKNSFLEIFKAGAQWKEEQIMKDAVNAKIGSRVEGIIYDVDFNIDSNLEPNDKVKVIIIKSE